jgi:1,4-alpha-glucan branching enzyme
MLIGGGVRSGPAAIGERKGGTFVGKEDTTRTRSRTAARPSSGKGAAKAAGPAKAQVVPATAAVDPVRTDFSLLTDQDLYLFNEGTHIRMWEKLGSHPMTVDGVEGTYFAVWAPDAYYVFVMGDFNAWSRETHRLRARGSSGIWEGFVPGVKVGDIYKFYIHSRFHGYKVEKTDPYAVYFETPPRTGSVVWNSDYSWNDGEWMADRRRHNHHAAPISIYEAHLGSWRRTTDDGFRPLSYRELARPLADYLGQMGFTHVEFLPIMEHPFYGSWGYQTTGYFAPTSRYGTPQDFKYLVDVLHQRGIGVLLDWVPSHFPTDLHGLGYFDGSHVYEHADPREGFHQDWKSLIFNYGRNEVRSFLLSSAAYWVGEYHLDGLRVDAVASMLYRDYSRKNGEWIPNQYGGNENLEAISLLRRFNEDLYREFPDIQTFAEESTAWPMVSRPSYVGGLGFGFKWDMGWMHDMLTYMSKDPIHRPFHHNNLTFRMLYAFGENFVLPLSHDEVTHGKGSMLSKMPGDYWQKFANLRALYGYMYCQPAKKLLFMGGEIGQWTEWNHESGVEWDLLKYPIHEGMRRWVEDLNKFYRAEPAMHELDLSPEGFEWIDCNDVQQSLVSFIRKGKTTDDIVLAVFNFTPVPRVALRIGAPRGGFWREALNSDASLYGGSNMGNGGGVMADAVPHHGRPYSLQVTVPPLGCVVFKNESSR